MSSNASAICWMARIPGGLARTLFRYEGVKVLLLSAAPYKICTMNHGSEDHYRILSMPCLPMIPTEARPGEELRRYRQALAA